MKNLIVTVFAAFISGAFGAFFYDHSIKKVADPILEPISNYDISENYSQTKVQPYDPATSKVKSALESLDFVEASAKSTSSVVFIQTLSQVEYSQGHWMDWFFEPRTTQRNSSGSGVIFTKDGYIVTNNHVVQGATNITVIHGKESYPATLIGTDPSTDLAVIKIEGKELPAITLGKSAAVKVGEWVLAVGNPFNLTSTVTAGIVSAKGRNINILSDKFPIESFIQTDAAINPGNSGGALVNSRGELVGINTAILSKTGSYAGYGFAVPVDIVNKVFTDIKTYGEVQKAFIGAEYMDVDTRIKEKVGLENVEGVIVIDVQPGWAADKTNIKKGDIILQANGTNIDNKANLEELLGNMYPGDQLNLKLKRDGKELTKTLTVTNREGGTGIIKRELYTSESLGVVFEALPKLEKDVLAINGGVRVVKIQNGFFKKLGIPEGFIVTQINNNEIESPEKLADILEKIRGRVIITGIDVNGRKVYYPFMF
uniref:trypsin-like peptidase domain-containing protein n=1 Tax=Fulvivirga sp. TaxID=1931237 RepID=UPI0040493BF3